MDEPGRRRNSARAMVAVLAGGSGSRLGGAKSTTRLGGRPLISYPVAAGAAVGLEVVVVAKRDSVLGELHCRVIAEPDAPRHPLCGIVAALEHGGGRPIVVVACDMPFVTGRLLAWLAAFDGAAVAEVDGRLQPLLARYLPMHLPVLRRALGEARSLRGAVAMLDPHVIRERELRRFGDPARLSFTVNAPADLAVAERWLTG